MMSTQPAGPTFREGDEVVLAKGAGSYQGTLGISSAFTGTISGIDAESHEQR